MHGARTPLLPPFSKVLFGATTFYSRYAELKRTNDELHDRYQARASPQPFACTAGAAGHASTQREPYTRNAHRTEPRPPRLQALDKARMAMQAESSARAEMLRLALERFNTVVTTVKRDLRGQVPSRCESGRGRLCAAARCGPRAALRGCPLCARLCALCLCRCSSRAVPCAPCPARRAPRAVPRAAD